MKINDFPKDIEWILNRFIEKNKAYFEFECWHKDNIHKDIAYYKTKTASW